LMSLTAILSVPLECLLRSYGKTRVRNITKDLLEFTKALFRVQSFSFAHIGYHLMQIFVDRLFSSSDKNVDLWRAGRNLSQAPEACAVGYSEALL
jgi:hypothetical protein